MGHGTEEGCCDCGCGEEKKPQAMTGMAMEVGDKAWMAVLQRKFEAKLEKKMGRQMENLADIAFDYVTRYYGAAMRGKTLPKSETDAFEKRLNAAVKG